MTVVVGGTFAARLEQDGRLGVTALDGSWRTTIDAEGGASVRRGWRQTALASRTARLSPAETESNGPR